MVTARSASWILRGGLVSDGLGNPLIEADLAIVDGRLRRSGQDAPADALEIDATGLVIAPGFIDIHAHNDLVAISQSSIGDKIAQGVTTEVNGNCGFSPFPVTSLNRALQPELLEIISPGNWSGEWGDWDEYATSVLQCGTEVNIVGQVGHGALRSAVMGLEMRRPTDAELGQMERLLDACLAQGASGLSFGLMYHPSGYADATEIARLSGVAARHDCFVSAHLRGYDTQLLLESIDEMIVATRQARARLQISHLAPAGPGAERLVAPMLDRIDRAIGEGVDIGIDRYPYEHAFTRISLLMPGWFVAGRSEPLGASLDDVDLVRRLTEDLDSGTGRFPYDHVRLIGDVYGDWQGLTLAELADRVTLAPALAAVEVVRRFGLGAPISILLSSMAVQQEIIGHPACMVGSDGMPCAGGTHPRTFGTFPRILGQFVRDGTLKLEQAIHKMTGQPAAWLGLPDRGRIADGLPADLVLFDPGKIADRSTFGDPYRPPEGIAAVFVNGIAALLEGKPTGMRAGRILSARRSHS